MSWLAKRGRWLSYSVGMVITETIHQHVLKIPALAWTPAVEADGTVRDGAWVAELTGSLLHGWPKGMRLIVRKERPHPGAQLRITDADGMRITSFATNAPDRPIAALELRHRLRARVEDRIRAEQTLIRPNDLSGSYGACSRADPPFLGDLHAWRSCVAVRRDATWVQGPVRGSQKEDQCVA